MQVIQERALLLEALSDKVLHQLPPAVWKGLILGPGRDSIRFEQRHLSLVYADPGAGGGEAVDRFHAQLQLLNGCYLGRLDPWQHGAALASFEDPGAAVRVALELQRLAGGLPLRIGVVSGVCTLGYFRVQDRLWCTPLGTLPERAAIMAASASPGSVLISPEAREARSERGRLDADLDAPEFADSERDLSTLALPLPMQVDIPC